MDIKMEIKDKDPLSDDISSRNDTELFTKNVGMTTNSNTVLLTDNYDMAIKMEIKAEESLPNFHVIYFSSQNESEFVPEDLVMEDKDDEIDNKIEIKKECCWLETETSSGGDEIKNEDFPPVESSRLCIEADFGDCSDEQPLPSAEGLSEGLYTGKESSGNGHFRNSKDQRNYVTENHFVEGSIYSEQSRKHNNDGNPSNSKQHNVINERIRPHKCQICAKRFTQLSYFKLHNLSHEDKMPHKCTVCEKKFTWLSQLKKHNLIHGGKKPHRCEICEKRFTDVSHLKRHNMTHEGRKPHKCGTCERSFTDSSDLRRHNLVHEGKKPYKCSVCDKGFTRQSHLKNHHLRHEGKRPHKCKLCDKGFTELSHLKRHILIHEGKKPYQCDICEKRFTELSNLKKHYVIHKDKKFNK